MPRKASAEIAILPGVQGSPGICDPALMRSAHQVNHARPDRSQNPAHFRPGDEHLLEAFAQAVWMGRQAYGHLESEGPVIDGKTSAWVAVLEKAHRATVSLSGRLRLAPQMRFDSVAAGKAARKATPASFYDMRGDADDDAG